MNRQVAVVIVVRDGRERIARPLRALLALPEQPQVVVVDNDSRDGTAAFVLEHFGDERVRVVGLARNRGAAGRNAGVAVVATPYVAFAEDDSWYEPGALARAVALFDAHPRVGLLNAHVLVGEDARIEPLHADMVDTPVPDDPCLPGHRILSFLEGVSIVRRSAFCEVGGFDPQLGIGGPEEHLAADLLCCGWELRYVPQIVARHVPDHRAPSRRVRRLGLRNTLWFAWRRRPPRAALRWTWHVIADSPRDRTTLAAVAQALAGLPSALRRRRPLPAPVELQVALLDEQKRRSAARSYGGRRRRQPTPRPSGRAIS
ncbi:MAG: glycosyltransferase [Conexibacter sp.]|jgi:GT2 family glycosyltransferase|nr:glycosyltransferase [Conexibacter sp.]